MLRIRHGRADGKWVTFPNQREDGNFDIVVMDSAGGPLRPLTTANNNLEPRFSRDGSRIWFVSNRTGRNEVYKVPFAGGADVQVTHEGRGAPRESPDGMTPVYPRFGLQPARREAPPAVRSVKSSHE